MAGHISTGTEVPFSDYQWYLWLVGNNAHFYAYSTRQLQRSQFDELVDKALDTLPLGRMAVDTERQVHYSHGVSETPENRVFETRDRLDVDLTQWLPPRYGCYENSGRPAFLARCASARTPDANGMRSLVYMQTGHAIVEGLDLSRIVRGDLGNLRKARPAGRRRPLALRLAFSALAALLAPAYLVWANAVPARRCQGAFHNMVVNRDDLRRTAREFGVGHRALCFAAVLRALWERPKSHNFTYVTLPFTTPAGENDEYINFIIQPASVKPEHDIRTFARSVEAELKRRDTSWLQMQYVYMRINRFFRRIAPYLPFLFSTRFRQFAPTDIVMSMITPIRPRGLFGELADGPVFCGGVMRGGNNCTIVPQKDRFVITMWLQPERAANLPRLVRLFREMGIGCDVV